MPAKKSTKKAHSLGNGRRISLQQIVQAEQDEAQKEKEKKKAKKKPSRKYRQQITKK